MRYIDVAWRHQVADDPVRLVSELDDSGFETRKLEFFRDGRVRYAPNPRDESTFLGERPVPALVEINLGPQFVGVEITAEQFEALWRAAVDAP